MILIDGSLGEGGGQIVRSSLTLALVTGQAFTIEKVRDGRAKPGLKRQHLTAVQAAARVGSATVEGDSLGSSRLVFQPQHLAGGDLRFDLKTAGSTMLVAQTLLPALLFAEDPSEVHLIGGTHNPMAPPFDFLAHAFLPLVAKMGGQVTAQLHQHGFYPAGGGKCGFSVQPSRLTGLNLLESGKLIQRSAKGIVANLPKHIAERECDTFARKSGWKKRDCQAELLSAAGPGNIFLAKLHYEHITEVFSEVGQRGLPAEKVATRVWKAVQAYQQHGAPVGVHLADQLLLPMGLAAWSSKVSSSMRTTTLSQHSLTHIDILKRFLNISVETTFDGDSTVIVHVRPA